MELGIVEIYLLLCGICIVAGIVTFIIRRAIDAWMFRDFRELSSHDGTLEALSLLQWRTAQEGFNRICEKYNISFRFPCTFCSSERAQDLVELFSFGMAPELSEDKVSNFTAECKYGHPSERDYVHAAAATRALSEILPEYFALWQSDHLVGGEEIVVRMSEKGHLVASVPMELQDEIREALHLHFVDGIPLEDIAA